MMRQISLQEPGQFHLQTAPKPQMQPGHALVRVHRIGVCGTDWHAFAGRQPFFQYPRVLGHELGVQVIALDANHPNTSQIKIGDKCCIEPYLNCGHCPACKRGKSNCCEQLQVLGVHCDGGMGEWLSVPMDKLHRSQTLSFDQLALVETLCIGAHAVARAQIEPNETVLVIGVGPIGLSVAQCLLANKAKVVIADISQNRLDFCREVLGINVTIDPQNGDLSEQLRAHNDGELPTCVFDATGHPASMQSTFELVAHGGRIVFVGLFAGDVTFHDPNFHKREVTLLASRNALPSDFANTIEALETGRIDTSPWITHRLELSEITQQFATLSGEKNLVKAMIEVG